MEGLPGHFAHRLDVVHGVGAGDLRFEGGKIVIQDGFVSGARIGADDFVLSLGPALEPFQGQVVRLEIAVLGAHLGGHIGQDHARSE